LHCTGDFEEMQAIVECLPAMSAEAAKRVAAGRAMLKPSQTVDTAALQARLDELLPPKEPRV
jgi:beta-N-acetylhexosaminidase